MDHFFIVSQWDGKTFKIALTQTNTFETIQAGKLKRKLTKMLNLQNEELYLVHNGLLLDDHLTGADFGLKGGDIIFLFKRQTKGLTSQFSNPFTSTQHSDRSDSSKRTPSLKQLSSYTTNQEYLPETSNDNHHTEKPPLPPTQDGIRKKVRIVSSQTASSRTLQSLNPRSSKEQALLNAIASKRQELEMLQQLLREKEAIQTQYRANIDSKFQEEIKAIQHRRNQTLGLF